MVIRKCPTPDSSNFCGNPVNTSTTNVARSIATRTTKSANGQRDRASAIARGSQLESAAASGALEDAPVALTPEEGSRASSSIFAAQALCPFMAFVYHRLGAGGDYGGDEEGLDASEQGTGVHHALQLLHGIFKGHSSYLVG